MKYKILIVDDEPTILESGKMILEDEGYKVMTASNGRKAIDILETNSIQLVLTDFKMPNLNGLQLLKWIRKFDPDLPVFMITSYVNRSIQGIARRIGAREFMLKPIDYSELIERIEETIQAQKDNSE